MRLVIQVVEIRGTCPVYKPDSKIVLEDGYILDPSRSGRVCLHSLASIMPYYVALARGISARQLGIARKHSEEAYVQCLDPCDYTNGGTVVFKIFRVG